MFIIKAWLRKYKGSDYFYIDITTTSISDKAPQRMNVTTIHTISDMLLDFYEDSFRDAPLFLPHIINLRKKIDAVIIGNNDYIQQDIALDIMETMFLRTTISN